jgi:hypothetical protein
MKPLPAGHCRRVGECGIFATTPGTPTSITTGFIFMAASDFDSQGSSIVSAKRVNALREGIILLYNLEKQANKDSSGTATNFVTYTETAAAQQSFVAALILPARSTRDAAGALAFKAKDFVRDYFTFVPGAGELATVENLPAAIVEMAEQINYWEKQIESNLVINQANQVTVTPNKDTGTIAVNVSLPMSTDVAADGTITSELFDYLFVVPE